MNLLVWIVAVSFVMTADLQAAKEEKSSSVLKLALVCALLRIGESYSGDTLKGHRRVKFREIEQ